MTPRLILALLLPLAVLWSGCATTGGSVATLDDGLPEGVRHAVVCLLVERGGADSDSFGAAVVLDEQGRLVTAHHVVQGARRITVLLEDRRLTTAQVVAGDAVGDIALLQCAAFIPGLMTPAVAADGPPVPGATVFSLGNPFGTARVGGGAAVSRGVVSALKRSYVSESTGRVYLDCIQHDAPTNPGSSGGGLFDARGRWIGMNAVITALHEQPRDHGVAFALPVWRVRRTIDELAAGKTVNHGWLGARSYRLASQIGADGTGMTRAVFGPLDESGPAYRYGLQPGDVVIRVDGREIFGIHEMLELEDNLKPGEMAKVRINRAGLEFDVHVEVGRRSSHDER